jgi:peptidoglycan biosynthesis protein MviN/MurJ (putative lipid II flippase)
VTATREEARTLPRRDQPTTIAGTVDLVKAYARQETIGPIKGAGRWIGMGLAGAVTLAIGLGLVLLGLLRLIQTEWTRSARGSLSWLAYTIVLLVCVGFIALAVSRINRDSLNKHPE